MHVLNQSMVVLLSWPEANEKRFSWRTCCRRYSVSSQRRASFCSRLLSSMLRLRNSRNTSGISATNRRNLHWSWPRCATWFVQVDSELVRMMKCLLCFRSTKRCSLPNLVTLHATRGCSVLSPKFRALETDLIWKLYKPFSVRRSFPRARYQSEKTPHHQPVEGLFTGSLSSLFLLRKRYVLLNPHPCPKKGFLRSANTVQQSEKVSSSLKQCCKYTVVTLINAFSVQTFQGRSNQPAAILRLSAPSQIRR